MLHGHPYHLLPGPDDEPESKQEEQEHKGDKHMAFRRSAFKFFPDKDTPQGRDQRCALTEPVGDGWTSLAGRYKV